MIAPLRLFRVAPVNAYRFGIFSEILDFPFKFRVYFRIRNLLCQIEALRSFGSKNGKKKNPVAQRQELVFGTLALISHFSIIAL